MLTWPPLSEESLRIFLVETVERVNDWLTVAASAISAMDDEDRADEEVWALEDEAQGAIRAASAALLDFSPPPILRRFAKENDSCDD